MYHLFSKCIQTSFSACSYSKSLQDVSMNWTPFSHIFKELSNDTKHSVVWPSGKWLDCPHLNIFLKLDLGVNPTGKSYWSFQNLCWKKLDFVRIFLNVIYTCWHVCLKIDTLISHFRNVKWPWKYSISSRMITLVTFSHLLHIWWC